MENKKASLERLLNFIVSIYILSYVLPSGDIGNIPIQKYIVYILLIVGLAVFIEKKVLLEIMKDSHLEIIILGVAFIRCVADTIQGHTLSIMFGGLLYISVVVFLEIYFLRKYDLIDIELIIKSIFAMLLIKIIGKMLFEMIFILKIISYDEVSKLYLSIFNTQVSTMTMKLGELLLVRIQSSSDAIVISLMPFLWIMPCLRKRTKMLLFVLTGVYVTIVFSRIFIVQFCCFAVVVLIYYWKKIPKKYIYIGTAIIAASAIFWLRPVISMVKFRFFSSFSVESDSIRTIQGTKLIEGIIEKPWWGHGMGSYLPDLIRSESIPFSYEREYMSFVYQLGIFGFLIMIGGNIVIFIRRLWEYFKKNSLIVQVFILLGIGWMLIRPLFNPSFLGIQNGFTVIGILLFDMYYADKKLNDA